jgi:hypothetical protein
LAWERVLSRVSLADACRLARVAPATREAAGSESVWRAQYAARWGARAVASLETRAAHSEKTIRWRDEYRARHARDANMTCPECLTGKVTPIVYGFPSPSLVAAMRDGVVLLGGDYLVEGDPNWACKACQSKWRAWPFSWPDESLATADERRRARVSSRPGFAGAGHGGGGGLCGGGEDTKRFAFGDLDVAAPVETSRSSPDVAVRSERNRVSFENDG